MAGRQLTDVHRSILRYLSTILPEPWDVQPERREPQTRPVVICQPLLMQSIASQQRGRGEGGTAYVRDYTVPFETMAYPPGADADPMAAREAAVATYQTILRALDSGFGTGRDRGYSMRVPFYDWTGIGWGEDLPDDQQPFDYIVIQGLYGSVRQDPEQDDLYTVMVDFRANWLDDGDLSRFEGAPLLGTSLGLTLEP